MRDDRCARIRFDSLDFSRRNQIVLHDLDVDEEGNEEHDQEQGQDNADHDARRHELDDVAECELHVPRQRRIEIVLVFTRARHDATRRRDVEPPHRRAQQLIQEFLLEIPRTL